MADRPLKPAIDRRLGRPLPHQLSNLTRANPSPINLSPEGRMRYYSPFPVAIPQRRAYSHALLTRPPLPPKRALDLHVLGLPPAFVLSQDQTLKLKSSHELNLDVRTSAHHWICLYLPGLGRTYPIVICLLCFRFHKKPETVQTVKLTLDYRVAPTSAIYRR